MLESISHRLRPSDAETRRALVYTAVVANTLVLALLVYAASTERPPTTFWVFPVVWITVAVWALLNTSPVPADVRTRLVAAAIGVGYFLVLGLVGGLFGPSGEISTGLTLQVTDLPPGWNPAILYSGQTVQFAIVPFTALGYATLSYLVYATAIEAKSVVAGGVLGIFSCVSCTLPVIASVLGGVIGGGAALTAAASSQTYAIGTVVFVVTVGLLSYRPGLGWLRQRL